MKRKKWEMLLAKVDMDKHEAFVRDMRNAAGKAGEDVLARYGVTLTDEERKFLLEAEPETVSDETLTDAAGGKIPCDPIYTEPDPTQETC